MQNLKILNILSDYIYVDINSCGDKVHGKKWFEQKVHSDYDIWYITSGKVIIETEGLVFTAKKGDIVFFYPGIYYKAYTNDNLISLIFIHFNFRIGNNFKLLNYYNFSGIIPNKALKEILQPMERICGSYENGNNMAFLKFNGYFLMLLSEILLFCNSNKHTKKFIYKNKDSKKTIKLNKMQFVFSFIEKNLGKKFSIKDLSEISGLSEKYFISNFKNLLGISPGQYIYTLKMKKASDYLKKGIYSIKEISNMLGYTDQYAFSKAFKKYHKIPPSMY